MRGAEGFSLGEGQRRIELTIKYINEDDVVLAFFLQLQLELAVTNTRRKASIAAQLESAVDLK